MIRFVFKRLMTMIPVLLFVTLIIFTMTYFTPGDPAEFTLGDLATEQDREVFREEHGLNDPYLIQYFNYITKLLLKGDLGTSYATKRPVMQEILERFPNTVKLAAFSTIIAVVIGIGGGILSATKQYSIIDNISTGVSLLGVSIPVFWLGMMLILLFSVNLRWFPASGSSSFKYFVLPAFTLGSVAAASIMRMTRSSMLEVIRQDYIRTARAKGQTEKLVIWMHALKNSLIPVITVIGLQFGRLLGGAVVVESVFSFSGLGKLMVDSIMAKNSPVVQGGVLFIATVMCITNLVIDVLYGFVDPRIRSQYMGKKTGKAKEAKEVI